MIELKHVNVRIKPTQLLLFHISVVDQFEILNQKHSFFQILDMK